jgi:hypothetical protein
MECQFSSVDNLTELSGGAFGRTARYNQHTGLGFIHCGVGIGFGRRVVVSLSSLAVANFALVFALLALCRLQVVASVAAKAKMRVCARTLRLLLG